MAQHVIVYRLHGFQVQGRGVRARANHRHITQQHIPELGQFIEVGAAQHGTEGCYTRVVFQGLVIMAVAVGIVVTAHHGTELITGDLFVVETPSFLLENNRPPGTEFNDNGNQGQQPTADEQEKEGSKQYVETAFEELVLIFIQRQFTDIDHRQLPDIINLYR